MPAYNCGPYIGDAIKSILAQTMKEFELIIINDGSTDDTLEVVESFRDSRLRVVNQSNQGLAGVRNRAVKEASADYISWLDSDDLATPDRLEKQIALLDPFNILRRGYSITLSGGVPVTSITGITEGAPLVTRVADGTITSKAISVHSTTKDDQGT